MRLCRLLMVEAEQTIRTVASKNASKTPQTILSRRIFVGNIEWITGQKQIKDYFSKFGNVRTIRLNFDRMTGLHKGYAHVTFADSGSAEQVLAKESHTIDHRRVVVNRADMNFAFPRSPTGVHPGRILNQSILGKDTIKLKKDK